MEYISVTTFDDFQNRVFLGTRFKNRDLRQSALSAIQCLIGAAGMAFLVGVVYKRKKIHDEYGGQRQGGISTPFGKPLIFAFSGKRGREFGYNDRWEDDGSFSFFGHGQVGDMILLRGNSAVRDHVMNGKELHLFEAVRRGRYRYVGQMTCSGYGTEKVHDKKGQMRKAIVFQLVPLASLDQTSEVKENAPVDDTGNRVPPSWYWTAPLEKVRAAALAPPPRNLEPKKATRNVRHRSEAVKVYVQRRAQGRCEGCHKPAPFLTKTGRPYLEPHHTQRLSDSGPDNPRWVVAVCPNCHRRAHHAADGRAYNRKLMAIANRAERSHP